MLVVEKMEEEEEVGHGGSRFDGRRRASCCG